MKKGIVVIGIQVIISMLMLILAFKIGDELSRKIQNKIDKEQNYE